MRIDNKQIITQTNDKTVETRKAEAKRNAQVGKDGAAQQAQPSTDSVVLSGRARDIAEIARQLRESADVREDRVNELKAMIQNGTYSVSGMDIAESIIGKAVNKIY